MSKKEPVHHNSEELEHLAYAFAGMVIRKEMKKDSNHRGSLDPAYILESAHITAYICCN